MLKFTNFDNPINDIVKRKRENIHSKLEPGISICHRRKITTIAFFSFYLELLKSSLNYDRI